MVGGGCWVGGPGGGWVGSSSLYDIGVVGLASVGLGLDWGWLGGWGRRVAGVGWVGGCLGGGSPSRGWVDWYTLYHIEVGWVWLGWVAVEHRVAEEWGCSTLYWRLCWWAGSVGAGFGS